MDVIVGGSGLAAAIFLWSGIAIYRRLIRSDPAVTLAVLQGKKFHAVQWARYFSQEVVTYRKRGNHIAAAEAQVEKSRRMRSARIYSAQAEVLKRRGCRGCLQPDLTRSKSNSNIA